MHRLFSIMKPNDARRRYAASIRRRAIRALLLLLTAIAASASPARAQSVWELTPYKAALVITTDSGPAAEARLADRIARLSNALVGGGWDLVHVPAPDALRPVLRTSPESLDAETLPEEWLAFDKLFLLTVRETPRGHETSARDYDMHARRMSAAVEGVARHPSRLPDVLFQSMCEAFAPLATIEFVEEDRASLRLRAAALARPGSVLSDPSPGALFQPILRYNNRDGTPRAIRDVPWTVLRATEVDGAEVECRIHSGIRSPLSVRRRGWVEQYALGMVVPPRSTELTILARDETKRPLDGYVLQTRSPDEMLLTSVGRTDRHGRIELPYDASSPLRIAYIRNGRQLLARLPIVAGYVPRLTAEIPNDDARLAAEGRLLALEEQLIDVVTQREILVRRVEHLLNADEADKARDVLTEFNALTTRDELLAELKREHAKLLSDDPLTQRKVDAMFDNMERLIFQQMNTQDMQTLRARVYDARANSSDDGAADTDHEPTDQYEDFGQ